MAIRVVRENGDEILRKKSREVESIDDKIREILDDMVETLHKYNGVGLAGPQIGILKRIIVIDLYDDERPMKLINPAIVKEKGKQEVEEGCLSFPLSNIHKHQLEHIRRVLKLGGISFIIVRFNLLGKNYVLFGNELLEFIDNNDRKSIPYEYFVEKGYLVELKYSPRLDYLDAIDLYLSK